MTEFAWITALVLLLTFVPLLALKRILSSPKRWEEELSSLAEISDAMASSPADPEELAEIVFLETARLLETDFFQLGVFEEDSYRTLFLVRDGNRQENFVYALDPGREGIIGWVNRTGQPLLVSDFQDPQNTLPAEPSYESHDPPRSGLFVPLRVEDNVIGILAVQSRRPNTFSENDIHRLTIIANSVAVSLAKVSVQSDVEYRTLQLLLIQEVSRRLISLQPLSERLSQIAALIMQAFEYEYVALYELRVQDLHLLATSETMISGMIETVPETGIPELVRRASEERTTLIDARPSDSGQHDAQLKTGCVQLCVPLKVEDRVLGVLDIETCSGRTMPPEQIALAEMLAAQMAIAVLEARNFSQQQEETWITTVLLEVARHAAQPGDAELALQAVLQLIILLTGTNWAVLLLPDEKGERLRVGPTAGLRRQSQDQAASMRMVPHEVDIHPPFPDDVSSINITLTPELAQMLDSDSARALVLSDGVSLLGVLLLESQELEGRRVSLLAGIAHQISLRLENTRLIDEAATRRSFERELTMARSIQSSFIPKELPEADGWEIGATWGMAREVGGDFYDFIPLPEGSDGPRWGVVIADVADKGIPAALFMALCRTLIRSVAISRIDPGETLTRVNQLLFADTKADLFVSAFYSVWEPANASLTYANAGHNPPLLLQPETPAQQLRDHGMVLGVQESEHYKTHELIIEPGQLLVLYTDGVTEATGTRGEFFGLHRLENLVLGLQEWRAQGVANLIAERVSMFSGSQELSDDLTAVVIQHT